MPARYRIRPRNRTRNAKEKRALQELIGNWSCAHDELRIAKTDPASALVGIDEAREWWHNVHRDIHGVLGELADDEREQVWPAWDSGEQERFDRDRTEWLRTELRRLDSRLKFLHESKAALASPSPGIEADLATAAADWGAFVANCSRAEERALGLDVRLQAGAGEVGC